MRDFDTARQANRRSVEDFTAQARAIASSSWHAGPAEGKWSPAQVTEHVALAYETTRDLLKNMDQKGAPALLRPVIRFLYVRPILKSGKFPRGGKAPKQFRPITSDQTSEMLCARLKAAAEGLEQDFEQFRRQGVSTLNHPFFGKIPFSDVLQFQAFHTTHHQRQLGPG